MNGKQCWMLAKGHERSRTRVAVGFCYKEALVSLAVLKGVGGPKPGHIGSRTSASRQGLDLFVCWCTLVSKMAPGIQ